MALMAAPSPQGRNLCIFCDSPANSSEHVLLEALGGQFEVPDVLCANHNSRFGGTIDTALYREFHPFCVLLGTLRGDGRTHAPLRSLAAKDTGEKYDVLHGGVLRTVPVVPKREPSSPQLQMTSDPEDYDRIVNQILRKLGKTRKDLNPAETAVKRLIVPAPQLEEMTLSLGQPEVYRSICKSVVVLLASVVERPALDTSAIGAAMRFVRDGEGDYDEFVRPDCRMACDAADASLANDSFRHVITVSADPGGAVEGRAIFFGAFAFVVRLAETWGGPRVHAGISLDPITREQVAPAGWHPMPREAYDQLRFVPEVVGHRTSELLTLANRRMRDRAYGECIDRAMDEAGLVAGAYPTQEMRDHFLAVFMRELSTVLFGIRHEIPLDVNDWIQNGFPKRPGSTATASADPAEDNEE
jgi:hypothetical protein